MYFSMKYFIAAPHRHPLSYFIVQLTIWNLLQVGDITMQSTAQTTGPWVTKMAVMSFSKKNRGMDHSSCLIINLIIEYLSKTAIQVMATIRERTIEI